MRTFFLMVFPRIFRSLNFPDLSGVSKSGEPNHFSESSEKFFLYPNPATTELNMEIGDTTLENALVSISDMSGRKLLMLPVKEREMLRISLDGRFTPSDYGVTIRDGKRKIYRVFKVGKKMFNF